MAHSRIIRSAVRLILLASVYGSALTGTAADWPMFGRDPTRNAVSPEKNAPIDWDIKTGRNIKWKAKIGSYTFGAPVVANGLVWIGTNNDNPRERSAKEVAGVLMCFRESDGQFLYQHISPARQGPTYHQAQTGISCSPLIEGDRLWFVTTRAEIICLDIGPLRRGLGQPQELWKLDMIEDLAVVPRRAVMGGGGLCSIGASYGDLIYVITGNGTDGVEKSVPNPLAPGLVCLNKITGKVVWEDNSSSAKVLFGEWGHPTVIEVGGRAQIVAPQGDGWVRSFDALTGELIWKLDSNPKSGKWPETRGFFSTPPVFYRNRVYITTGNYLEFGELPGRLCCIDPTRKGDISLELDDGPGRGKTNPNSGVIWHFDGMSRTMSTVVIENGLVIAPDFSGIVHCLNAENGEVQWRHDMRAQCLASPLIVDGKVFICDGDGDICILGVSSEKKLIAEHSMGDWMSASPIFANGILYLVERDTLFAIEQKASADWPQWRGPDRTNISSETGLLKAWPEGGPPLIWSMSGIGLGIHSVSVAGGRLYTTGNIEGNEMLFALDSKTGEKIWALRLDSTIQEGMLMRWLTQRSPTVDGDRVYALTMNGELLCLRTADGEKLWQRSYPTDFGTRRHQWGYCDHPLVEEDRLICTPFGTNAFIAALQKRTGEVIWQTKVENPPMAGHASLVVSEACGVRQYIVFHARGMSGFAAIDGKPLWDYARRNTRIASSYTPLVRGDLVCSPNGYGGGLILIKLNLENGGWKVTELYDVTQNFDAFQDSTALVGDYVYTSRAIGLPACIEFQTGKLIWNERPTLGSGRLALVYADGHLYLHHENGTMTLVEATTEGYKEKGMFKVPDHQPSAGATFPVIAAGRLYLRDNDRLFCYDISMDALALPRPEPHRVTIALSENELNPAELVSRPPRTGTDRAPDAVFIPTPNDVVARMLELAGVKKESVVVDLGSGDGRILIAAAKKYGCQAIGYEIDPRLVEVSREAVAKEKLESLARIEHEDIFTRDLSGADVVTVFLYPRLMERLIPQLNRLKPGARIVSHQFEMPGVKPDQMIEMDSKETGDKHRIFLWTIPLKIE